MLKFLPLCSPVSHTQCSATPHVASYQHTEQKKETCQPILYNFVLPKAMIISAHTVSQSNTLSHFEWNSVINVVQWCVTSPELQTRSLKKWSRSEKAITCMDGGGSFMEADSIMLNIHRITTKPQKHTQDWRRWCYWFCLWFLLFTYTGPFRYTSDVWFWSITHGVNPSCIYVSIFRHTEGGRLVQIHFM